MIIIKIYIDIIILQFQLLVFPGGWSDVKDSLRKSLLCIHALLCGVVYQRLGLAPYTWVGFHD